MVNSGCFFSLTVDKSFVKIGEPICFGVHVKNVGVTPVEVEVTPECFRIYKINGPSGSMISLVPCVDLQDAGGCELNSGEWFSQGFYYQFIQAEAQKFVPGLYRITFIYEYTPRNQSYDSKSSVWIGRLISNEVGILVGLDILGLSQQLEICFEGIEAGTKNGNRAYCGREPLVKWIS